MRAATMMLTALVLIAPGAALAKGPVPDQAGGGSLPLADVLEIAKPYPNLTLQVRLQLVRANVKRDQVVCTGGRFGQRWATLNGARLAPYECAIGKRTLVVTANQTFFDKNGRKLTAADPALPVKATKVKETGLAWKWK
jgi:hypothetical protein